ncbi:hypothetical protein Q4519_17600 [Motilimonas sp. 1_MG-2023]|uniref:DUF6708 domain-containing protein n=1 Tax=Motilimonas sp. 1_MG-2023 TaxID=3062672 RepID=UPI0026E1BB43|nr:DUF6708 domain-containing protein [Motilimonas sp. 1_MG-2023]MDO6527498.1 hypothetical protein [Motilimonas sp. 1_MG-2023]
MTDKQEMPFKAGRSEVQGTGQRITLSPLPVATNIPKANACDLLAKKCEHYIDIGGAKGSIFQAQYVLILAIVFGWASYSATFGISFYNWFEWKDVTETLSVRQVSWDAIIWQEVFTSFAYASPVIILGLVLTFGIIISSNKDIARAAPLRFHRQRREVMFSRWNEKLKQTEYKVVPWEKVVALVGQGSGFTGHAMVHSATLFIGANDEDDHGHFWSAAQVGAGNMLVAAAQWEMIRHFMEYGPDDIPEPSPESFAAIRREYCESHNCEEKDIPLWIKIWWYVNGTPFGILLTNYRLKYVIHRGVTPAMQAWSEPLPRDQWAKPSEELQQANKLVNAEYRYYGKTLLNIGDIELLAKANNAAENNQDVKAY